MNNPVPDPSELSPALRQRALPPVPFGPAPLIEGEDAGAYDELLVRISTAVRPADIFEEIWVRDIVDLVWEAFRLRRLKACLMTAGARKALAQGLAPVVGWSQAEGLARSWAAREPGAVAAVEGHLATAGIGLEGVAAQGLCIQLDHVERIERNICHQDESIDRTLIGCLNKIGGSDQAAIAAPVPTGNETYILPSASRTSTDQPSQSPSSLFFKDRAVSRAKSNASLELMNSSP
jgi:hypothetical protein